MKDRSKRRRILAGQAPRRIERPAGTVPDGKVRCGSCDGIAAIGSTGRLRKHRTPAGDECPNTASGQALHLDSLPPVVIPAPSGGVKRATAKRPPKVPSRLDVGTGCRECGKWLPGERSLCGACYVKREASR